MFVCRAKANDSILKNLPWSPETTKWANSDPVDPSSSSEAIQERIKTIRDILRRPDPVDASSSMQGTEYPDPVFEEDTTDQVRNDELSLGEIQADLRGWWKGGEEQEFYERLATFKAKLGDDLADSDVYEYWIDEWTRKMKERI